jgi:mRNA interferase MazF
MVSRYVPERGDFIWLDFDPQAGHEIMKRRPALVLSPKAYNKAGMLICCPTTSRVRGLNTEVPPGLGKVGGVILSDQIKSLDWKVHKAEKIGVAATEVIDAVLMRIAVLLQIG